MCIVWHWNANCVWYWNANCVFPEHCALKTTRRLRLRSKAAECRGLVNFGAQQADRMHGIHGGLRWYMLRCAADALRALSGMVREFPWPRDLACRHVDQLHTAWAGLAELDGDVFRVKPKFHLLRHLVADIAPLHGPPALYWCYQDEDWGAGPSRLLGRGADPDARPPSLGRPWPASRPLSEKVRRRAAVALRSSI